MPLSDRRALFGEPASRAPRCSCEELNAKGGVLGRKHRAASPRLQGRTPTRPCAVASELILKDSVDFLVGTAHTSAEGPAVSVVAKENKIVFIAPIPKTDQLTAPDKLHPTSSAWPPTTTIEGGRAAETRGQVAGDKGRHRWLRLRLRSGRDQGFRRAPQKLKPDVEIVDQQWPKLGEPDYTPVHQRSDGQKPTQCSLLLWAGTSNVLRSR